MDQSEKNKKGKVPLGTNLNCDFLKLKINFTMHWGLGRVGGRDVCGREGLAFPRFLFHLDIFLLAMIIVHPYGWGGVVSKSAGLTAFINY